MLHTMIALRRAALAGCDISEGGANQPRTAQPAPTAIPAGAPAGAYPEPGAYPAPTPNP
jgi:hypothetical protein